MTIKDVALTTAELTAKTIVGAIPYGSILVNVYDAVKGGCLDKRRVKWQNVIEDRLTRVEKTLEDIGNNECFTTTLIKATELAMKTISDEKINYLAGAVLNAIETTLEEEKLIIFMSLLEQYTVSHIKILHYFRNPKQFGADASNYLCGSPTDVLFRIMPELNTPLFNKMFKDLYQDGLVTSVDLNCTMTGSGMVAKRTTPLGDEFLSFILTKELN